MFGDGNRDNRTAYILFLTALAAALSIIIWAGNKQFDAQAERLVSGPPSVNFSTGWTLVQGGEERGVISMPFKADAAPSEVIELKNVLPKSEGTSYSISFHTVFSTVEVSSGDTLLYRYDSSGMRPFGKAAPSHWNLVRIPFEYTGQEITLRISSPYRSASGVLSPVWIGDSLQLSSYLMHKYIPQFIVCGVFFALGLAIIISSVFMRKMLSDICTVRCLGIFIVLASIWMMSEVELPDIIWGSSFSASLTRYIMAMISPVAYLLYLLHRFPKIYSPYLRRLCYLFSANFFFSVIFQLTDQADFAESAWVNHVCLLIMVITLAAIVRDRFQKEKPVSLYFKLECLGMFLLTCAIGVEIFNYYRMEYMMSGSFMRFGLCAYIGCLAAALLMDTRNRREEAVRVGEELQNSRLRLMVSQIQPHFIYNTLSSIRTLIKLDPDKAYDLVYDFSKYLRANIDSIGQDGMIPFSRELEHIKNYCNIEKIRFGDKLTLLYDIEAADFLVPPLTVQPLVENAIKHGIRGKSGMGAVKVHSYEEDSCYVIEVLDNGAGFDTSAETPKNSAGLKNIRFRLEKIADARLEISSIPEKGTRAVVFLPKKEAVE